MENAFDQTAQLHALTPAEIIDRAAIQLCLRTCNRIDPANPRIIRIKNTLSLTEFEISEAMLPEMKENMQVLSAPYPLPFDDRGNLI